MKLSIIIPVYNTAEYLPKCLDSVICPGVDGYEIIIVNDGSTDSSKTVAESYVTGIRAYPPHHHGERRTRSGAQRRH